MKLKVEIPDFPEEYRDYFETCARIRDITKTRFYSILLQAIAKDQMVLSILDDDSKRVYNNGGHKYEKFTYGKEA